MKYLRSLALGMLVALPLAFSLSANLHADVTTDTNQTGLSAEILTSDPLVGSWLVTLSNAATKTNHPALYSFMKGGVLTQSENPMTDPMLGNLVFSNAHGAWEYDEEKDSYSIRYFKLVYQADAAYWGKEETAGTLQFDKGGVLTGSISFGKQTAVFTGQKITAAAPLKQ